MWKCSGLSVQHNMCCSVNKRYGRPHDFKVLYPQQPTYNLTHHWQNDGWMYQLNKRMSENAKLCEWYVVGIIQSILRNHTETILDEINKLYPSLKFTIKTEIEGAPPFLEIKVMHSNCKLSSSWYFKPTVAGLITNFRTLPPSKYKQSVVCGFVHRIFCACSSWMHFHTSLNKAKDILERNQYLASF